MKGRRSLFFWGRYLLVFLSTSVVALICIVLLLRNMPLDEATLRRTAPVVFIAVLVLSLLITAVDFLLRKYTVEQPVKELLEAIERVTHGDFDTRLPVRRHGDWQNEFDRIAEGFNEMARELGGIELLRTDLVATVSHELKTPLAVIRNYGTMLQQSDLSEEQRLEYGAAVADASHRLAGLVSDVLRLNKLENQRIFPEGQPYDLGEQLRETLLYFEPAWEEKELDIEIDIPEGLVVTADAELLGLVWSNLLSNAVKFTEPGGRIEVSLREEDGGTAVRVADTGCGMDPETGAHIFEKFYQGDTAHAHEGSGLGLALVKRVIDIIGGSISVESSLGEGTTFTVWLERGRGAPDDG